MVTIQELVAAIRNGQIRISDHADEEAHADGLRFDEVFTSVLQGEIIEQYPKDRPFPSCLVLGMNKRGEPIHSVWAFNADNRWAVIITVYRPDPERWIEWKTRRKVDDSV